MMSTVHVVDIFWSDYRSVSDTTVLWVDEVHFDFCMVFGNPFSVVCPFTFGCDDEADSSVEYRLLCSEPDARAFRIHLSVHLYARIGEDELVLVG